MSHEWERGYKAGWDAAIDHVEDIAHSRRFVMGTPAEYDMPKINPVAKRVSRKKRKQSKKQKILNEMADKKWRKYKKGSGKKTYFDIRGMVSRSEAYKKKVKNL